MSVKRVFKIIGIVVGCVVAFVGAVLGVFAAMGKFKTPVVKPEKIYFEKTEQVVVAQYRDDKGKEIIYSFKLIGSNSSIDHEVNVKDCYIQFLDGTGSDLIEFCDKNGVPLIASNETGWKGWYKVECNEDIYYKMKAQYEAYEYNPATWAYDYVDLYLLENGKYVLNTNAEYDEETIYYKRLTVEELNPTLDPASEKNGKVVLKARTADKLHNTNQDLVIWVDRSITSIFLDYGKVPSATNAKIQEQHVNIGLDTEVTFNYVVNPEIAWCPISKESKKIVELYYDDPKTEDYVLVNLENIKNETDYSLYQIFDKVKSEETGELVFLSNKTTNGNSHSFKIAIFPSYNARQEYLASEFALTDTNVTRLTRGMVVTDLYVEVVNTNVDHVSMSSGVVNLQLYSQDDVVYLNNEQAPENNLNVIMKSGETEIDVRLDEVNFNSIKANRFYGSPKFVIEREQAGVQKEIDFSEYSVKAFNGIDLLLENKTDSSTLEFEVSSSIKVGEFTVINKITNRNGSYFCNNGIVFINIDKQIKLLNVGSYLDFYIYDNTTVSYTMATDADIKYSFETVGEGTEKQWKIVVEYIAPEILSGTKTLVLGLMVANNNGMFNVENLFATKTVKISIEELTYIKLKSSQELNFVIGAINEPQICTFNSLFDIGGGTYSACVLVISEDELDNALVEYINVYIEISEKKYYLVGYQNADKSFVNSIKAKDNAEIDKTTTNSLMLLQLTNGFNSETGVQETANELITSIIKNEDLTASPLQIENKYLQELYSREIVTINQHLLINLEEISINVKVDDLINLPTALYEKTEHTLFIDSSVEGLVDRLIKFYGITIDNIDDFIDINYEDNLIITAVENVDNKLKLSVSVRDTILNNPEIVVDLINVTNNGFAFNLLTFKILSSAPEDIVFYYENNADSYITLSEDKDFAPTIKAKLSWAEGYVAEWFVGETSLGNEFLLNNQIAKDTYSGFQDPNFKIVNNIDYFISGSVVIKDGKLEVVGAEPAYLEVVIAGVKRYVKIEVDVSKFALTQQSNVIVGNGGKLSNLIEYKFNNGTELENIYDYNLITLNKFIPQYREMLTCDSSVENKYVFKNAAGTEIFVIEKSATDSDWVLKRTSDFYASLGVTFEVVTKTHKMTVNVQFEQSVIYQVNNVSWSEGKLYQNTTIQLYEIIKNDTDEFATEALLKIRDKNGDNDVSVSVNNGTLNADGTIKLTTLGQFIVSIKVGSDVVAEITEFTVVPNIKVVQNLEADNTLIIGKTDAEVDGIVAFGEYSTLFGGLPVVYGLTKDGAKTILYSTEEMLSFANTEATYSSVVFESNNDRVTKTSGTTFVVTDWISEIGATEDVKVEVVSDGYKVGEFNVVLVNNFVVETAIENIVENNLNIKAMTDINRWLSIPGFNITKVQWKYSDANDNDTFINASKDIPELNVKYENVVLLLVFEGNAGSSYEGKTLTYEGKDINDIDNLIINIVPYELETIAGVKALSENKFNLLTGIYSVSDIHRYYQYIQVKSVKDKNGNPLTNSTLGYAYDITKGSTSGLEITFKAIVGDYVDAIIEYEVKYINGSTYQFEKEFKLENWQQIDVVYPENHQDFAMESCGCKDFITGAAKVVDVEHYEPILINNNSGTILNLLNDNRKTVSRFTAKDRATGYDVELEIAKLEIVAYQDVLGMLSYANLVSQNINTKTGEIYFSSYNTLYGILVFRLTSKSGNYKDYYVYVTSVGTNYAVSASKDGYLNYQYTNTSKTISNIVSESIVTDGTKTGFKNVFGEYPTNVKMFLLNATTLADNNNEFNATIFGSSVERYSFVNSNTITIKDYTTITLSLVYDDGNKVYPIGVLKLYLRPTGEAGEIAGYSALTSGVKNGEYALDIDANQSEIEFPSGFDYDANMQNGETVTNVVEITSKITLNQKVTKDYKFVVFYKKGDVTIKVVYTYKAVNVPQAKYVEVGLLDKDLTNPENTKFNNSVEINENYFGTYQGDLKIGGVTFVISADNKVSLKTNGTIATGVDYLISDNKLKLTFAQGLCNEDVSLAFEFLNLQSTNESRIINHVFNVKSGVLIESLSNDNSGVNTSQRLKTTPTGTYNVQAGNVVAIQKYSIDGGVRYEVGGHTIYINNENGKLEFAFTAENTKYVLSDDVNNKQIVSADDINLEFVHLASAQDIDLLFKVSNGTNFFKENATSELITALYLTIAQTYVQVEPVYVVKNVTADSNLNPIAENVAKGAAIGNGAGESLAKYLFETTTPTPSSIKNATKLRLKVVNADGSTDYATDDFSGLGFLVKENPNFVRFAADANGEIKGNADGQTQYIQFNSSLNQNALCNVLITNNAGMASCSYTFQVMADAKKDGITFSNDGFVDQDNNYMSFTINDDTAASFASKEFLIGTISDSRAKGVYVLDASGAFKKLLIGNSNNADDVTYLSTGTGYKYKLILKNNQIFFQYIKENGVSPIATSQEFSLFVHGSTDYILKEFKVVVFNVEITPKEETRDSGVYGGDKINLKDKLRIPDVITPVFTVDWENSKFGVTSLDTSLEEENNLLSFAYEGGNPIIKTKTVGQAVLVDLVFDVKIGTHFINSVTYQMQINRSIQFFFNGTLPANGMIAEDVEEVYEYETNFALTNNGTGFAIEKQYVSTVDTGKRVGNNYSVLSWNLLDIFGSSVQVEITKNPAKPNPADDVVLVLENNGGIRFVQDYTGELNLLMTAKLTNGFNYSVNWKINVNGIISRNPVLSTNNGIVMDNSLPIKSGTEINLVSTSSANNAGIVIKDMSTVFVNDITYDATIKYDYAVLEYNSNDGLTNQARYARVKDDSAALTTAATHLKYQNGAGDNNKIFKLNMPIVPSTLPESSTQYLVIFKLNFTYLNKTTENYYVAYLVTNPLQISVASTVVNSTAISAESINVDERLSGNNLDLFYYSETYTVTTGSGSSATTTTYQIIMNGLDSTTKEPKYQVSVNGADFVDCTLSSADSTKVTISYSSTTVTANKDNSKTKGYYEEIANKGVSGSEEINILGLFNLNFNSIVEFGEFIKRLDSGKVKIGDKEFAIKSISNGRWGIDLTDNGVLFYNKLENADLVLVADNGQPIYKLAHYNPTYDTGFRLYASTSLTPKGAQSLATLFIADNVKQGYTEYKNAQIVGVYKQGTNPVASWVNNASTVGTINDVSEVEISVPIKDGKIDYNLKSVRFKGTGTNDDLYKLEEDFYVIEAVGYDAIYKMSANRDSVVAYKQNTDTVVDLTGANANAMFVKFKNDASGALVITDADIDSVSVVTNGIHTGFTYNDDNKITMLHSDLQTYKNANPTKTYVVVEYNVEFDGVTLKCEIAYELPQKVTT